MKGGKKVSVRQRWEDACRPVCPRDPQTEPADKENEKGTTARRVKRVKRAHRKDL